VLTQSSIVIMPRRPMIIFDETVVSGTVLLLTPLLISTAPSPLQNNSELGRAQRLTKFGSTAGGILKPRSEYFRTSAQRWMGARQSARFSGQSCVASKVLSGPSNSFDCVLVAIVDWFELLPEHRPSKSMRAPGLSTRAYGAVIRIADSRSMLPDPLL
jgi:hypothetical protein